jgi:hypothetical protein
MSRGAQTFKQGNVTKALKAAEKAGLKVRRAEVRTDGSIVLDFNSQSPDIAAAEVNEWDSVLK